MKHRVVEILFKRKWMVLLPFPIIMALAITAALRPQPDRWETSARAWVDQYVPLYKEDRLGYTPGPTQAQLLNDFIRTRSFARSIIEQTPDAPLLADAVGEQKALVRFWRAVTVSSTSNSFITITVVTESPERSTTTARALVEKFEETLRARGEAQTKIANTLAVQNLERTRDAAEKSRLELANYLAARPELTRAGDGPSLIARDATYSRLSAQAEYDQSAYRDAQLRFDQNRATGAAGIETQTLTFTVIDQPQTPAAPLPTRRSELLKLPIIGFIVAAVLSAITAVVLIITNRSVIGTAKMDGLAEIPMLGQIPVLRRRRRFWQRAPRHAVRLMLMAPAQPPTSTGPLRA